MNEKPPVKSYCGGVPNYCTSEFTKGTVEWSKIDDPNKWDVHAVNISAERVDETAKAEHEPVAWYGTDFEGNPTKFKLNYFSGSFPLYTAPPVSDYHEGWEEGFKAAKKEWVGLTDEDYDELLKGDWGGSLIQRVEAKLKEKNGG